MKEKEDPKTTKDNIHSIEPRKPFVAPRLRREAALAEATAERGFTFGLPGGS